MIGRERPDRLSSRWISAALLAAPLVAAAVAYGPALRGELHFDDQATLSSPRATDPSLFSLADLFIPTRLMARPLTQVTFALNRAATGLDPFPLHATNLALHLAAAILAWAFLRATFRRAGHPRANGLAIAVAGLFALHPIETSAVAFVCQRSEVLSSALYLTSLLLLLLAERHERSAAGALSWAGAAVAFLGALSAKQIAITLPAAYLLHRAFFAAPAAEGRSPWRARMARAAPLLAIAAVVGAVILASWRSHPDAGSLGPWRFFLTQLAVVLSYVRLVLWPAGLTIDRAVRVSPGLWDGVTLLAGACLAALAAGAIALRAWAVRHPASPVAPAARIAGFGVLWFFLLLSPTSSFIPIVDLMVEHRVYLASLGLLAAGAAGVDLALARSGELMRGRAAALLLTAAAEAVLAVRLHGRAMVWRSDEALWREAVAVNPAFWRTHWNLGCALQRREQYEGALAEYVRAEAVEKPGEIRSHTPGYQINFTETLIALGRADEARARLEAALAREPSDPRLHRLLARAFLGTGDFSSAADHAAQAVQLRPDDADALETAGEVSLLRGDLRNALTLLQRSAAADPLDIERIGNVAQVQAQLGLIEQACASWDRVVRGEWDPAAREKARAERAALPCGAR